MPFFKNLHLPLSAYLQNLLRRIAGLTAFQQVLFTLPYLALLIWFHAVDVYHQKFSEAGPIVLAYNFFRVLFIFYLFWTIEAAGILLLRVVAPRELAETGPAERIALAFFTGAGVWHAVMVVLGYFNLYYVPIAIVLTLPLVMLSYGDCNALFSAAVRIISKSRPAEAPRIIWLALAACAPATLLFVKGLYPAGGNDYFTHYFYYFQTVIDRHGIWPNEVWYHYYYDKGAGVYFLGMLITDALAPQLVTFCFVAAAALVVFLASRAAAPRAQWPWISALLFVIIYIYTPNWAEFEKTHEPMMAFTIASIWIGGRALARCGSSPNVLWPTAAGATIVGAVILTSSIAVFFGCIFGILSVWYLFKQERSRFWLAFMLAALNGVLLAGTFAIDFAVTGLFSQQQVVAAWPLANLEKLNHWDYIGVVLKQYWGTIGRLASPLPWRQVPKLLDQSSRLDLILPFAAVAVVIGIGAVSVRRRAGRWTDTLHAPHQTALLLASIPAFLGIALTAGRIEPISFYRYASFAVPLMLVGAVTLWDLPIAGTNERFVSLVRDRRAPPVIFGLCLLSIIVETHPARGFDVVLSRALRFAFGAMSIDTAYTLQRSWPNEPWGAIYPGSREAFTVVGAGVPIWSFNSTGYCMLPGCRMETFESFILPDWDHVMFTAPAQARQALQASRHNYFMISLGIPLDDYLARSPLFAPDNIAKYLGARWSDGTTTLLTWLGPGVQPLGAAWVSDYRRAVEQSPTVQSYPYQDVKDIFARLNAMPHPWHPFPLPWH